MVTCSATNSVYFNNYKFTDKDGHINNIIGGGSIAESPSLYAFFSATELLGVPPEKVTMTIVGAVNKDNEKIEGNVNPI